MQLPTLKASVTPALLPWTLPKYVLLFNVTTLKAKKLFLTLYVAQFFLDLVNSDFTDEAAVTAILDTWEEKKPDGGSSSHHKKGFDQEGQEGVTDVQGLSLVQEVSIMFRRHGSLIARDPILYIGRCVIFLVINMIFALVYLSARDDTQDQSFNKFWVMIW